MASIRPILSFTNPIRVSNIDDNRIGRLLVEYNGELVDVLSGSASKVLDIIELNHVLVSPKVFEDWLVQSDFGKILNRWIISNYEILTISVNDSEYGFLLSSGNSVATLFVDHSSYAQRMVSKLLESINVVKGLKSRLLEIQSKYNDDDPFIQLIDDNHISDYVSFEHLVRSTGEFDEVQIYLEDIYKDTNQLFYNDDQGLFPVWMTPNVDTNIKYEYSRLNPIYDRVVKDGDIIDLTIGYRVSELLSAGDHLVKYEFDQSYSSVLPSNGVELGINQVDYDDESNEVIYNQEEILPEIHYEGADGVVAKLSYNGYSLVRGRTRATSVTTLIKVGQLVDEEGNISPITQLIGNDFLVEITNDRLVVYSINPRITEYIIKSCRKINLLSENPTEVPTEEPSEVPTESPTTTPTESPTVGPTESPTQEPPYVVPDLDNLGLTSGYPEDQGHYFYELSGVRPIRIYEAYSDCGKHFTCYWGEDYMIEMGDDYLKLPFRVVDFFNREDKVLEYLTHDPNDYSGYGVTGKDTFQLDRSDSTVWQFRGNDEGHWELVAKLRLSTNVPSGLIYDPDIDQFNRFIINDSNILRYKLIFHNGVDPTEGYEYQLVDHISLINRSLKSDLSSIKSNGDYSILNDRYYLGISLSDDTINTDTDTLFKKFGIISTTYKYPAFE